MDLTPRADELWKGIGGHFDSIGQVLCEFIDNSISNYAAHPPHSRSISLRIDDLGEENIRVRIEDCGTGIANFEPALRIGETAARESPLNEHGFGLKHAIASANPGNNSWTLYTRTQDEHRQGTYRTVSAPYSFDIQDHSVRIADRPWPGVYNGSGTVVEFTCTRHFFERVQEGIQGRAGFVRCLDYLKEDLGFVYSELIRKGAIQINLASETPQYHQAIEAVEPVWLGYYDPRPNHVDHDLGGGRVRIEYKFGEMGESDYIRHYKRNMATSGVEIRINGRLIMSGLFEEIWEIAAHPSYNHFLATIDIISANRDALPKTRTSKNGLRIGDEKLTNLFAWIRNTHPQPEKKLTGAISEHELVAHLRDLKDRHIRAADKRITQNAAVYERTGTPVEVDLYVFDGRDVVLYEAKKGEADLQDLYQLLMYWDGAVYDGRRPTEGILIASSHSAGVGQILPLINAVQDRSGNNYNFSTRTWRDEGVEYP